MSPSTQAPHWEWFMIGMYFFVGGTAAGAYFIGSLLEFFGAEKHREISKAAYAIAFPLALLCPILLIGDLGQPTRFVNLFLTVNWQSPVSFGSWALLIFGAMTFLSFVDTLIADGKLKFAPFSNLYNRIPRKVYAIVGSVAGFFIAGYTGVLLNITARPFWAAADPLLGALFIASGASAGAAAIALVLAWRKRARSEAAEQLERFDRIAMGLELLLIVGIVLIAGPFAAPILSGSNALLFWGGAVLLGVLVPLGLNWYAGRASASAGSLVTLAAILILVGSALLRISVVQAGNV